MPGRDRQDSRRLLSPIRPPTRASKDRIGPAKTGPAKTGPVRIGPGSDRDRTGKDRTRCRTRSEPEPKPWPRAGPTAGSRLAWIGPVGQPGVGGGDLRETGDLVLG